MCGIAGIIKFDGSKVSTQEIDHFSEPIKHRGPDDSKLQLYHQNTIAFAHKRLSILDLSVNAAQPMRSASGKFSIVYNGEIFNFIEIKAQLATKGYKFITETDTEVVICAFEEWGTKCFNKFNGMWAMAIYNHISNEIILCRDRFGIKPLYYQHYGSFFAFASETNCFRNIKNHSRSFNLDVLSKSLIDPYYSNSISSSIFEGIEQLKPGHYMMINSSGLTETTRYYNFSAACAEKSDITYQTGDFLDLFTDAVKLRLRSDVMICPLLKKH
jgi:asparagine synthase (glutamine-hydrolysing)